MKPPIDRRRRNRNKLPPWLSAEEATRIAQEKEHKRRLNATLAEMGLSQRVLNALESGIVSGAKGKSRHERKMPPIITVSDLLNAEYEHVTNLRNLGKKTLLQIAAAVERDFPERLQECKWLKQAREPTGKPKKASEVKSRSQPKTKLRPQPLLENEAAQALAQVFQRARQVWPRVQRLVQAAHSDASSDFLTHYDSLIVSDRYLSSPEHEVVEKFIEADVVAFGGRLYQNYHALALQGSASLLWAMKKAEVDARRWDQKWSPRIEDRSWQHGSAAMETCKSVVPPAREVIQHLIDEHEIARRELRSRLKALDGRIERVEIARAKPAAEKERRRLLRKSKNAARDERDAYAYGRHGQDVPMRAIIAEVNERSHWPPLTTVPSLLRAIKAYAKRKDLPPPKRRKRYTRRATRRPRQVR